MDRLKKTSLFEEHESLNAKIISFAGWSMPLFYTSILDEHSHTRKNVSIFDTSHMGEFVFKGDIAESGIDSVFTQSAGSIPTGASKYGFILNKDGGIVDDLIVFKIAKDELMLVVNAATSENDFKVIKDRLKSGNFSDVSFETAKLDIQGPLAMDVMEDVLDTKMNLEYFKFGQFNILGENCIISRTGYTGELGYEIFTSRSTAIKLWNKFIADERVKPAGLGARDILRLEMGYSLYGSDLDEKRTPLEAGLEMFVDFEKKFTGRDALLKIKEEGLKEIKIAFIVNSRQSPRQGNKIFFDNRQIGLVTSGGFSPSLEKGIGLGYVESGLVGVGSAIEIQGGGGWKLLAEIVKLPFYKKRVEGKG